MANLIDHTYFIAELNIPNTSDANVLERITFFITKYEKEYLMKILGVDLYNDFITGLAAGTPDAKWTNLKNGQDFNNTQGIKVRYFGLVNTDKNSPIANYVYYHFIRDGFTNTSGVGEVQSSAENAAVVSPALKLENAWNEMVRQTQMLIEYLYVNNSTYTKFNLAYVDRSLITPINRFNI